MHRSHDTVLIGGSLVAVCALLAGCKSDRPTLGTVSGTVTLDGRPLPRAVVTFIPETDGRASMGTTDDEGRFELVYLREERGAIVGEHRVRIRKIPTEEEGRVANPLPRKYDASTELTASVQKGENTIDFELSSR